MDRQWHRGVNSDDERSAQQELPQSAVFAGDKEATGRLGTYLQLSAVARFSQNSSGVGPQPDQIACGPTSHDVATGTGDEPWPDSGTGQRLAHRGHRANFTYWDRAMLAVASNGAFGIEAHPITMRQWRDGDDARRHRVAAK